MSGELVIITTEGVSKEKAGKGKMRTGNTLKIITVTLLVIALMSATVFAAVGKPPVDSEIATINMEE